jgi:hypothetical protein
MVMEETIHKETNIGSSLNNFNRGFAILSSFKEWIFPSFGLQKADDILRVLNIREILLEKLITI